MATKATCRVYRGGRLAEDHLDTTRISEVLADRDALLWLDVERPDDDVVRMLGEEFGFHPLALEDVLERHQRPKIEQYETYFFLVAYAAALDGTKLVEHEVAAFVGRNYLVTVRKDPPADLSEVAKRWEARTSLTSEGGGYLLYILLDDIVDGYFDVLDGFEDRGEDVEESVFGARPERDAQAAIFGLKKELVRFRRLVAPLRDVLDVMQRRTVDVVTEPLEPYYRDVYDHVLRATDFLDSIRDILSSALEAHLAVVSNRLNEVMKSLTSWAAIILIPTLIAGIYGMNFLHMPELRWRFGYVYALALMLGSAAVLYRVFKKREWL